MKEVPLSPKLSAAVHTHSQRYVSQFRDIETPTGGPTGSPTGGVFSGRDKNIRPDKLEIMTEVPILSESDLPADHPRREPHAKGHSREKLDAAVKMLKNTTDTSNIGKVFSAGEYTICVM